MKSREMVFALVVAIFVNFSSMASAQTGYIPFGEGDSYTYNNIPFEVYGVDIYANGERVTADYNLAGYKGRSLHLLTYLYHSQRVPDIKVAEITIYYENGTSTTFDLAAGYNTAEWVYDRPGLVKAHSRVEPAYS